MFIISGDSTKEWDRYSLAGSSGWSILNDPPPLLRLPLMFTLPSRKIVLLPVRSVMPRLPAPSALPLAAERMFHVCPPELVLPSASHVPKVLELSILSG